MLLPMAGLLAAASAFGLDPAYQPLTLYKGSWLVTPKTQSTPSTDLLRNDCAMAGRFFACQQTVNGKPGSLLVIVPASKPGDYYTQTVQQEGWANGRGALHIDGNVWTYSGKSEENGKTTWQKTTNLFTGRDRIHYEVSVSQDGVNWTVTAAGDEVRTSRTTPPGK